MPKNPAKRAKEYARLQESPIKARPPGTPRPKHKRRRLTDGLIGLSSAAILSVYGLGYFHTQSANGDFGSIAITTPGPRATPGPQRTLPGGGPVLATPTPQPGTYHDGTYTAVGSSRHGDIEATIVVKNGKIASANVTGCGTRYPCSDVNPLVREVVSSQGAPLHYVSGATDSSRAYTQAVQNALAQAS